MAGGRLAAGKKNAARLGAHLVFVDETGFQLIPTVRRTWAPRAQTPVLRHSYRHDRLSVISGLTVSPRRQRLGLVYRIHPQNINGSRACAFLRQLLRHFRGPLIVIWDNLNTHHGREVRALCQRFPRLHLEYLPPYAPDLNPDEGIWHHAKRDLANHASVDELDLWGEVIVALERTRWSPARLRGCFRQAQLPLRLPK